MNNDLYTNSAEQPVVAPDASPKEIAEAIVGVLDKKKARDIALLHVEEQTSIADYFVVCTANSRTQVRAFIDEVEYKLSLSDITPHHIEGVDVSGWMLIDFGAVIVHVFSRDAREFYNLEKLYAENSRVDITSLLTED
ncbi:MAG: ribosome silencing factor [Clostridia bacterium]|nr:ribosome silencing factor [Clostridia bacterium]